MLSIARVKGPLIMAIFPLQKYVTHTKSGNEPVDTPMERIKNVFIPRELEPISKELRMLLTVTATAGIVGMLVGGTLHTQSTVQKFIENNEATRFYSHYDAQKQLQQSFAIQFLKGAYKFGWRTTLFTAIFGSIELLLTTYYGESSVWHYVVGGGTAGFLFKLSLGMGGALVGLIVGGILGGIGGFINFMIFKLTGLSMEDLQNMRQEWAHTKDKKFREAMMQNMSDDYKEAKLLYDDNKEMKERLSLKENKVKE